MDYEQLWYDEIVEQWVTDFVYREYEFDEIEVTVSDPSGDAEPGDKAFEIKNIIFTIEFDDVPVNIWVFYDLDAEELVECEALGNFSDDPEGLAKQIFEINERWKEEKRLRGIR